MPNGMALDAHARVRAGVCGGARAERQHELLDELVRRRDELAGDRSVPALARPRALARSASGTPRLAGE